MRSLLALLILCGPWVISYYGESFRGQTTAMGAIFNPDAYTAAAHPGIPFGTMLRVCDAEQEKCITVEVNDRGPFCSLEPLEPCGPHWLDLSEAAFAALWPISRGRVFDAIVEDEK